MTINVFLLSAKKQHGKDSVFKEGKTVMGWSRVAFADKLKEQVKDLYGFSEEQMYGSLRDTPDKRYPNLYDDKEILVDLEDYRQLMKPNLPESVKIQKIRRYITNPEYKPFLTPRRVLQIYGQQQRALYPDVWAAYVYNVSIPKLVDAHGYNIAITDVRFPNEIECGTKWVNEDPQNRRIIKVRIIRPTIESNDTDISETALDSYTDWDFTIVNDGTLEDLKGRVQKLHDAFLSEEAVTYEDRDLIDI